MVIPSLLHLTFKISIRAGVLDRLSSTEYSQSNERAELGVTSAKRIIFDVVPDGSLQPDTAARATLKYRNISLPELNFIPAHILFSDIFEIICQPIMSKQRLGYFE